jgi:tRNA (guanine6-N2)-methyltransferase
LTEQGAVGFFALTTRGLEDVAAAEITELIGRCESAYRRVSGTTSAVPALMRLRTVDDVFVHLATWTGVATVRAALADLARRASSLAIDRAVRVCAQVREIPAESTFALSVSFVGKRNYSSEEIKAALAPVISSSRRKYRERDDEADLNIRLFIEHDRVEVGVRLGKRPLQDRAYKIEQMPGSLKPPIAAAMIRLLSVTPGMILLDPCCGAGTIAIEGALSGATVIAGDVSAEYLEAARRNAHAAAATIEFRSWDLRTLPFADASIARIAANLPWDRQVPVGELDEFYRQACRELSRVLAPAGRLALLTTANDRLEFPELHRERASELSVAGQRPILSLWVRRSQAP